MSIFPTGWRQGPALTFAHEGGVTIVADNSSGRMEWVARKPDGTTLCRARWAPFFGDGTLAGDDENEAAYDAVLSAFMVRTDAAIAS